MTTPSKESLALVRELRAERPFNKLRDRRGPLLNNVEAARRLDAHVAERTAALERELHAAAECEARIGAAADAMAEAIEAALQHLPSNVPLEVWAACGKAHKAYRALSPVGEEK